MAALRSIGLQVIALDFLKCRTWSRKSRKSGRTCPSNSNQLKKISVFVLIVIAMMIKAFNYLTEWPKFEKSFHRSDSQYIKNSLFEKTILSTVQRSIRRMSNVTLMRPNNGVHRIRLHISYIRGDSMVWNFVGRRPLPARDYVVSIKGGPKL